MIDDSFATAVATAIARYFETDPAMIPLMIKTTQLAFIFLGLAAISFTINTWTDYRLGTQGKRHDI